LVPGLYHDIAVKAADIVHTLAPVGLANVVLAFARTANVSGGPHVEDLFSTVAKEATGRIKARPRQFNGQDFTTMCYAFALYYMSPNIKRPVGQVQELFHTMAEVLVQPAIVAKLRKDQMALLLWSFARMGIVHPTIYFRLSEEAVKRWDTEGAHTSEVVSIAWALATTKSCQLATFSQLAISADPILHKFTTEEMTGLAWAFSYASIRDEMLFNRISTLLVPRAKECSPRALTTMAGALANVDVVREDTFAAIEAASVAIIADFKPLDLAIISSAFASTKVPSVNLFRAVEQEAARAHMPSFDVREITSLIKAFAASEVHDGANFLGLIAAEVKRRSDRFTSEEMEELASAFLKAGVRLGIFPRHKHQQLAWEEHAAMPTSSSPWRGFPMVDLQGGMGSADDSAQMLMSNLVTGV